MNALTFHPAKRRSTNALIALIGPSGSGKTYSAILMARGLVGQEGKFGVIDTENERATYYDQVCAPWQHLALRPPFSPARYIEAIEAAERAGLGAVVIDSMSHEWEGLGGVCEMAEAIEEKTKKSGLHCWTKPKGQHRKLMNRLAQTPFHIIFCVRAKSVVKQTYENGKSVIVDGGMEPVCEKTFMYDMTVSLMLDRDTHFARPNKVPDFLLGAFPEDKVLTAEAGAAIRAWCEAGQPVDPHAEHVLKVARDVASMGIEALRKHWREVSSNHLDDLPIIRRAQPELESIAREADRASAMVGAASKVAGTMTLEKSDATGDEAPESEPSNDENPFGEPAAEEEPVPPAGSV